MQLKIIGLYAIIILVLLRFLIYPLNSALQEKRVLLGEQFESYQIKGQILDRQSKNREEKVVVEKKDILPHLYEKTIPNFHIQSDILEQVIKIAEKKGLLVLNFEMMDPLSGKNITEVSVSVRLKGKAGAFIEILEDLEKSEKVLGIRSLEITKSEPDHVFYLILSGFKMEI